MSIQIIAIDPATHTVVPREAPEAMAEAGVAGAFRDIPKAAVHDIYDAMLAAAQPPPPIDVVKRLEWEMLHEGEHSFWRAGPAPFHFQVWPGTNGKWLVSSGAVGMYEFCGSFATHSEALTACQREFNRLVAECLAGTVGGGG